MNTVVRVYTAKWVSITTALRKHLTVPDGVVIEWVDVEEEPGAGNTEWPAALPALEVLVDGQSRARRIGAMTNDEVAALVTAARGAAAPLEAP